MITKTLGSSGADFTDINSWVSWVQANAVSGGALTDNVTLNVLAVGYTAAASQTISGWTPSASNFTTTIGANTGASFRDNANVQTNALFYNTANGAFMDFNSGGASFALTVSVNLVTIQNLQLYTSPTNYVTGITWGNSSNTGVIQNCIVQGKNTGTARGNTSIGMSSNFTAKNCLFVDISASPKVTMLQVIPVSPISVNVYDCTFANAASAVFGNRNYTANSMTVKGCVFSGCTNDVTEANQSTNKTVGSNNATTQASFNATYTSFTSVQTSMTAANEFQSSTSDFRLKSTSTACKNNGTAISGITTDIAGTTRPQGTTEDIGCWELVQSSPSTTVAPARNIRHR